MERLDVSLIKPLYKVATLLSITPRYDFLQRKSFRNGILYPFLVFTLYAAMPAISLRERFNSSYPFTPNITDVMLDCGSYIAITTTNLTSIFWIRVINSRNIAKFFRKLQTIDSKLNAEAKGVRKRFTIECCIFGFMLIFGLTYNETFWDVAYGFHNNWAYCFANFQRIHLFVTSMLAHNLARAFLNRFKYLNFLLEKFMVDMGSAKALLHTPHVGGKENLTLEEINKYHKQLLLMFRDFNKIFGVPIICLSVNFLFGLLHPINSAILQFMKGNVMTGLDVPHFGKHYVTITSIMTFNTMVLCIPLASSCNAAGNEARRTHQLYKLIQDSLPIVEYGNLMTKDLDLTSSESVLNYPNFHACSFYPLDHTTLTTLLGSISAYLILLIQINTTPE